MSQTWGVVDSSVNFLPQSLIVPHATLACDSIFQFPLPPGRPLPPPLNFLSFEPLQIHTYDHDRNDDFCGAVFFFLFSLG